MSPHVLPEVPRQLGAREGVMSRVQAQTVLRQVERDFEIDQEHV